MDRYATTDDAIADLQPAAPVYCFRPQEAAKAARTFLAQFPGTVAYAVKTNPDPIVLTAVAHAGLEAFDVASIAEMRAVRAISPKAELFYMHPVKSRPEVVAALQSYGVRSLSLDHRAELEKILDVAKAAEIDPSELTLFVRLATQSSAAYELSKKFGADTREAAALLKAIAKAGAKAALCFHVGSQSEGGAAFEAAVARAAAVRDAAGVPLAALSVGGGFPAPYADGLPEPLERILDRVVAAVRTHGFGGVRLIAEPGRAIAAAALSVVVQVTLRKGKRLHINDGVWGTLSDAWTGKLSLPVRLIRGAHLPRRKLAEDMAPEAFRIMGATCDSVDILPKPFLLPPDVDEGDWIEVGQVGAYSLSLRTWFNGFYPNDFVEIEGAFGAEAARKAA
ncbi:type III PLP-dependent enzyme domain-containing protein [Futiania mangrovi]|uniref:Ornithine decarboxylase n=1 Tax=Futiania mangrovi TaxID=2959716 RepID=A0A9J6PML2_9PROT|nr:ornithine decarboxylase [Futiania mangrovii]MCP1337290.1 ornithine decarboxylase [Futiania mangrovii]